MSEDRHFSSTVKIPQDVSRPDKILFGATARQAVILSGAAVSMWLCWLGLRHTVPALMFAVPAALVLLLLGIAVSAERDGVSVDRLLLAALRQGLSPRRRVMAPEGIDGPPEFLTTVLRGQDTAVPAPLSLPVQGIGPDGVVDLGSDGCAVLGAASTVNFALRTPAEQDALVAGFGRWLNSLTGPVQLTSRTTGADMAENISALRESAPTLPHRLLEAAALGHADFLERIAESGEVLNRSLLLTAHEPDIAQASRAHRRISDSVSALSAAEIAVETLDAQSVATTLAAALDPDAFTGNGA